MAILPIGKKVLRRIRNHAVALALIAVAAAFLLGAYAFRGIVFPPSVIAEDFSQPPRARPGVPTLRHPLTGYPIEKVMDLPRVYAVMIDHMNEAWPQSGVDKAFLVVEAPVEAGIPRLMAFFSDEKDVQKIGPIRSARPYFIDWANEFQALYAHVGGSDAALEKLAGGATFDHNQFWNGTSFWRATDRLSPHNVYTSVQLLRSAWKKAEDAHKAPTLSYGSWLFKDGAVLHAAIGVSPTIEFSSPAYRASWSYDAKTNRYRRYQTGLPFIMEDGTEIQADTIAVIITTISTLDEIGHREVRTLGEGAAIIFRDGEAVQGLWKKPSASERLRFYDQNGEMLMNTGMTWMEVVAGRESVRF